MVPGIPFKSVDLYLENRQFLLNNLKKRGMGKSGLESLILNEVDQLISELSSLPAADPMRVLGNYTSNNFMMMCFGKRWDYNDPEYEIFYKSIERYVEMTPILILGDMVPVLNYLPSMKHLLEESSKILENIRNIYEEYIDENIENEHSHEGFDIVSDYFRIHNKFNSKERENLVDICQGLFFAATDTTAATTGYAIIHLINHPHFQEELFNELDSVLQGRDPTMSDIQNLPLMEATIWEVLRMNPNVPLIFHATKEAAPFQSYTIPPNTTVLINAYYINHNQEYFPNPTIFNPYRWLCPNGKFRSEMVELIVTFGMGRRVCPGRPLAKMEMFLLLVKLVQTFILSVPDSHPQPDAFIKCSGAVVVPDPFLLQVTRRQTKY